MSARHTSPVVLLVEDNPDDQELARVALEQIGRPCRLEIVRDGADAIAYLNPDDPGRRAIPRLVLLDINLPKLNGMEVLLRWRAVPALRYMPVVMLSTSQRADDVEQAYEAGANGYIVKPVDFEGFIDTLASVCRYWLHLNESIRDPRD